jgi:hypothetical protein
VPARKLDIDEEEQLAEDEEPGADQQRTATEKALQRKLNGCWDRRLYAAAFAHVVSVRPPSESVKLTLVTALKYLAVKEALQTEGNVLVPVPASREA